MDDGGADAVGLSFGGPDGQAVKFGAVGVACVHFGSRASAPADLPGPDRDVVDPGGQERAQSLLLAVEPCFMVTGLPWRWVVVLQQRKVVLPALSDDHWSGSFLTAADLGGAQVPRGGAVRLRGKRRTSGSLREALGLAPGVDPAG